MARSSTTPSALFPAILLFLALALAFPAHGQSILTVAGGGTDDGRLATEVHLLSPWGLAVDPDGTIWISDAYDNRVRRVDGPTGRISTIGGNGIASSSGDGGPARAASLDEPAGLLRRGNEVLVVDRGGHRVRRIDLATSTITTFAGGGGSLGDGGLASAATLSWPAGLAQDRAGNVFIASQGDGRVRRVDASTGRITTWAGSGVIGDSGDGGPATAAALVPWDVTVDASGNVFVLDFSARKVRRIAAATGLISTVAGNGSSTVREGELATQSGLAAPECVAVDAAGDLWIGDSFYIRKVALSTGRLTTIGSLAYPAALLPLADGKILVSKSQVLPSTVERFDPSTALSTTVAGGGTEAIGDGGPALAAVLAREGDVSAAGDGSVLVSEISGHRVRRFRPGGTIQTVAGNGRAGSPADGAPALASPLSSPMAAVGDDTGNVYIASQGLVLRVDGNSGILTRFAGGGTAEPGDGGPARSARLSRPTGLALDGRGGLLVADGNRIRRVDLVSETISTLAGTGQPGFSGDGGAATSAQLNGPSGIALDAAGNVFVVDTQNSRIRKVERSTGRISTVAGGGTTHPIGVPPVPGTSARLTGLRYLSSDASGNLDIANGNVLLRFDAASGLVGQVGSLAAGQGSYGDGGPLSQASFSYVSGVARDALGNLFVGDGFNRIRAVFACVTVSAPVLSVPADGATGTSTGPTLSWSSVSGAFRYDLYLGTTSLPTTAIVTDLEATTFTPLNLQPGTKYYWKVVAKGDPFCVPFSSAESAVRSFTTAAGCVAPSAVVLSAPADGARVPAPSATLSWAAASGAGTYDVSFGTTNPPPLAAAGLTSTSWTPPGLDVGGLYYWSILAHAACDPVKTASSGVRSFRIEGVGCFPPGAFSLSTPADGATGLPPDLTISWTTSPGAASYDLHLGLSSPPPLFLSGLTSTALALRGLAAGATIRWKVVARAACAPGAAIGTPVRTFTVRGTCTPPGNTSFTFLPPGVVGTGQTYTVAWSPASGLGAGDGYVVERSTSPSFSPLLDLVTTTTLFASFVAPSHGSVYHRVRAVPACDPAKAGPWSPLGLVSVTAATPNVVFSRAPDATVLVLGERLEDRKSVFALENVTASPLQVFVARQELQSAPFFTIADPGGGDAAIVTLEPRVPKLLEIRYSGPRNDVAGSYQGLVVVAPLGAGLAVTPYAFVNLKVGASPDAVPEFRVGGVAIEYAGFPGLSGDDSSRAPLLVDVRNPGSSPLELAAEVSPELWLSLEPG